MYAYLTLVPFVSHNPPNLQMATTTPVPTTGATRAAVAVTTKLKAAAAAVAFATHRGSSGSSGGDGVRGSRNVSRASGDPVGRTRVAPRPQSAAMRRSTVTGTYGQRYDGGPQSCGIEATGIFNHLELPSHAVGVGGPLGGHRGLAGGKGRGHSTYCLRIFLVFRLV